MLLLFKYLPQILTEFATWIHETYGSMGLFVFLLLGFLGFLLITVKAIIWNFDLLLSVLIDEVIPIILGDARA